MEDVLGWAAVLIGSIVMYFTGWTIIDPLLSIGITLFILFNVYGNLKGVFRVILQGTPEGLHIESIQQKVTSMKGVKEIHDVHLWTVDGNKNIMSLHAVLEEGFDMAQIKNKIRHELEHLDIGHVTIETEMAGDKCGMDKYY
jgi:cobalt-zinc-cadmium efflux system protein